MIRKTYIELPRVADFFDDQPGAVLVEYRALIELLEKRGRLTAPYAEKVEPGLFAIRLRRTRNIRVFYVYLEGDTVYGIHAYEKKSRAIAKHELETARRIVRAVRSTP